MSPFRRRDFLLLSLVVVSIFTWLRFTQFGPPNRPRVDFSHVEASRGPQGNLLQDGYADNEPPANATLGVRL
jgi:hypothetical protein